MYAAKRRQKSVERKFQFGKLGIGHKFQLFNDLFGQFPQGSFIGRQVNIASGATPASNPVREPEL